eukprot:TRINITY_DN14122_c0_g1_i1.p1 TRINITY_DN14122_c0_g1~~TRINITY_DN14122_c0_g1_i1.p1  ORF type:complete len:133 (+),score=12.20 TRINITY_DN14122_c0_g1_i1:109-507(+)
MNRPAYWMLLPWNSARSREKPKDSSTSGAYHQLGSDSPDRGLGKRILQHLTRLRITKLPILLEKFDLFVVSGFGSRKKLELSDMALSLNELKFKRGMKLKFVKKSGKEVVSENFMKLLSPNCENASVQRLRE